MYNGEVRTANQRSVFSLSFTLALHIGNEFGLIHSSFIDLVLTVILPNVSLINLQVHMITLTINMIMNILILTVTVRAGNRPSKLLKMTRNTKLMSV